MFLSLVLTTIATIITQCACQSAPTVTVTNGTYSGIHDSSRNQDIFLGIPYAQPPVGNQRLRKPLSLNTSFTDTRRATQYGYDCPQYTPHFRSNLDIPIHLVQLEITVRIV
jgi:hypothetical protein